MSPEHAEHQRQEQDAKEFNLRSMEAYFSWLDQCQVSWHAWMGYRFTESRTPTHQDALSKAAPVLLEACKAAVVLLNRYSAPQKPSEPLLSLIRQLGLAIAKAEESPHA